MSFNSYGFILLFLPLTFICYYTVSHFSKNHLSKWLLLLASLVFYAYYDLSCLGILLAVSLVNYGIAVLLQKSPKKSTLICGTLLNIVILAFFKYFSILADSLTAILHKGLDLKLLFPLGISFITFQQIAYLTDIYRKEVPVYNFADHMLFAVYFPKMAQGPIVYHNEFFPQLQALPTRPNNEAIAKGLYSFTIGLSKKVLLAELLGKIVDFGHGSITTLTSLEAILVILSYTFQLYFDFSGYCDMAIGISQLFGIELPQNFNSPYKALSIDDFWKRWHITLTRFLTKYIYIPLGGNRKGVLRTYLNIFIVFLVSGIWHGVGFPFLVWGMLHGLAQMLSRCFKSTYSRFPKLLKWCLTFLFLNITWVYFRSSTISDAHALLSQVFSGGFSVNAELAESLMQATFISIPAQFFPISYVLIGFMLFCLVTVILPKNSSAMIKSFKPNFLTLIFTFLLLLCSILTLSGVGGFLYTNF